MTYAISYSLAALGLIAGTLLLLECGRQIGIRHLRADPEGAMLFALALASALLAGYGMAVGRERSWLPMLAFALVMGASIYVILDIEYPRRGLIRVDAIDKPSPMSAPA